MRLPAIAEEEAALSVTCLSPTFGISRAQACDRWAAHFHASNILFEDKASGTALIQELIRDGVAGFTKYEPIMDKIMRLHSVSSTIENGFVYLPQQADWLAEYLNELTTFPSVFLGLRDNKPHDALLPEFRHEERLQLLTPTHF